MNKSAIKVVTIQKKYISIYVDIRVDNNELIKD